MEGVRSVRNGKRTHQYPDSLVPTLQCHSVPLDGSDGIVDVILRGYRGVHFHDLKIHRHAAEPVGEW